MLYCQRTNLCFFSFISLFYLNLVSNLGMIFGHPPFLIRPPNYRKICNVTVENILWLVIQNDCINYGLEIVYSVHVYVTTFTTNFKMCYWKFIFPILKPSIRSLEVLSSNSFEKCMAVSCKIGPLRGMFFALTCINHFNNRSLSSSYIDNNINLFLFPV